MSSDSEGILQKIKELTYLSVDELHLELLNMLNHMYQQDFNKPSGEREGLSMEDRRFLQIMAENITVKDGHYQLPLPLRNPDLRLPNNRIQASSRLFSTKGKLIKDDDLCQEYTKIMMNLISSGYARRVDTSKVKPGKEWYVPHFAVSNPKKDKRRIVFDFSAKFKGRCLNSELIQGPNLANRMVGVIIRFRKEEVAYMADVEAMYHQVLIPEDQRSLVRFLFWPDGDLNAEPVDYEMCVHSFGAVSSGSCVIFALNQAADDGEETFGPAAANAIHRNFYVDDHLKSVESVEEGRELFMATREMCASKGFNLVKFVSNSPARPSVVITFFNV